MKIQLDTDAKTIKLENSVKLSVLFDKLEQILPNNEWKKFTLETDTTIEWRSYPVYIPQTKPWYEHPWIVYTQEPAVTKYGIGYQPNYIANGNKDCSYSLKAGTYNIEL